MVMQSTPARRSSSVDVGRKSRTAGGVLRVGDDQVELVLLPQRGQGLQDNLSSGFADNVTDMQDTHEE